MKSIYVEWISERLGLKSWQVENCAGMFEEGSSIPFISRYRKEKTGGMDDASVAEVKHWVDVFAEMEKRKETILATIEAAGALTDSLKEAILGCVSSQQLEDLYLPFRPRRRTRATVAREKGLEPLAELLWNHRTRDPEAEARRFVGKDVPGVEDALAGARDIIAERLSENAPIREALRGLYRSRRICTRSTKEAERNPDSQKYRSYFEWSYPVQKVQAHSLLAVLRARGEGFLSVSIDADPDRCSSKVYYEYCRQMGYPSESVAAQIREAADDAVRRLLDPSISGEVLREAKEKADIESIAIFEDNLRQLLLSPPLGQKRVMAVDPGFRNGCKIACLDEQGALLHHEVIFPHPPQNNKLRAMSSVLEMVGRFHIEAIAVGNGTASRETVDFLHRTGLPESCSVWTVSEDGASVYSASQIARQEFPDEDVTVRGAVSIGRRLMDPLAELVKIDPKSLGIGQYQHDVDQTLLKEKLDNTVEYCVNAVGVNLNTASSYLLSYVAGIGPSLASNIVSYRDSNGPFASRSELRKVPRLGAKAFEQCAGFLRVKGGENPLDDSAVHPEAYHIVGKMARSLDVTVSQLVGNEALCQKLRAEDFVEGDFGLPTVRDILAELRKPGLDPREQASAFAFADDVRELSDLKPGMELPGIVTNITAFGAFVDIGLHENGLIHVSKMGPRGATDPSKVVKLHQQVRVSVLGVDLDRRRIALALV